MKSKFLLQLLVLIIISQTLLAQTGTHTKKGTPSLGHYWEYLPPGFNPANGTKYPIIIALHGCGEKAFLGNSCDSKDPFTGDPMVELNKLLKNGLPYETKDRIGKGQSMCFRNPVTNVDECFIIISPQLNNGFFGTQWDQSKLNDFVELVKQQYPVDLQRIYLTGLSLGGFAAWNYAQRHPDKLAALIPIAGGGDSKIPACNLSRLPIWAFHDTFDGTVPVSNTTSMETKIKGCGNIRVTLYENYTNGNQNKAHNAWVKAYSDTPSPNESDNLKVIERLNGINSPVPDNFTIYNWLLSHKRTNLGPIVDVEPNKSVATQSATITSTLIRLDPSSTIQSYQWEYVPVSSNPPVAPQLQNANTATLTVNNLTSASFRFRLTVTDNRGNIDTDEIVLKAVITQPQILPGKIEAESFVLQSGVSRLGATEVGEGQYVGNIGPGDYMDYNVEVQQGGAFDLLFRVSKGSTGSATFQLLTGNTTLETITVDPTGGWESWQTKTVRTNLPAGVQILRLKAITGSWNINWFEGKSVIIASHTLPGKIEAETYSSQSGVSRLGTAEVGEGRYIGNMSLGDFVTYNVNVQQPGSYNLLFRVSRGSTGTGTFQVSSGSSVLASIVVNNTGGWETWETKTAVVNLQAGVQVLKLEAMGGGWNLNWFEGNLVNAANNASATLSSNARKSILPEEDLRNEVVVYPNPANSDLHLIFQANRSSKARMRLVNTLGISQSWETTVNKGENDLKLDLKNFTSGTYVLEIIQGNESIVKRKVMIVK